MLTWKHGVAGGRETHSAEVVGIEVRELLYVELRDQDYLPVACSLHGHDIAKLGCSSINPMHRNDNRSFANAGLWARVENTDCAACLYGAVGVNKEAATFAQESVTH
jgi:hypothetical protein